MIMYFADRHMNILGVASDLLPGVFHIRDDMKTSEIESGLSTFEVTIDYKKENHITLKKYAAAGNFLLVREKDNTYIPYTIIDREDDIADRHVYVYVEDAGLDLLNEIVPAYEAVQAMTAADYVLAFTADSGFEIGINEIAKNDDGTDKKRTLNWDSESTATERIRSVATEFDNAEIGYSFTIDKFRITHKYINLYKKHGKDVSLELRFGREVDSIVEKESVANLVTALRCVGGTPEATDANPDPLPITLVGYRYDDGDIYTDGVFLKSREANKKWSRYLTESGTGEGYIVGSFDYDTTSQQELCNRAITELKKLREPEITYEVALNTLPENLKLGDTCRIVDDNGELYVSARLIKLKVSECNRTREATFGDFKKLTSGINDKVEKLAEEFAKIQAAKTLYTWMVFADDASGTNMSTSSVGKSYIGIATNKISQTPDLTNPLLYTFTRISAVDGRGFTVRGSWAPNTSYSITGTNIDVVEYEGSTYACNNSHVSGQTFDPSKWVLIAEKGTDGEDGYSPTATVTKSGDTTTITITDKNGKTTETVSDGRSITGVTNYYLATSASSGVTRSTSGWTTSVQSMTSTNQYLWNYEVVSYSSGSPTETSPMIIGRFGKDGANGTTGVDGKGITAINEYYQVNNDSSNPPGGTWQTTPPTTSISNPYLWNYEVITYTTGDPYESPKRIIGTHGATGATGATGASGQDGDDGYNQATIYLYRRSATTISTKPGAATYTFSTGSLTSVSNWTRTIPADDGTPCYVSSVSVKSRTNTASIAQADWSSPMLLITSSTKWYSGTAITGTSSTAAVYSTGITYANVGDHYINTSTQNVYRCTVAGNASTAKWVYEQNIQGPRGVTGINGTSSYFHVKYSNDGGSTFTGNSGEDPGDYIGTYTDDNATDSTSVSSYTWVRVTGLNQATIYLYKRSATAVSTKPAGATYTFSTGALTSVSGWSRSIPASDGNPCYVSSVSVSSTASSVTINQNDWSTPIKLVEDGEDGNGIVSKTDYYLLSDTMVSTELSTAKSHVPHDLSGGIVTMTDAMGDIPFENVVANILPIQSGSGDPSPTNIRSITGWTGATVTRTGKNLLEPKVFTSGNGLTNPVKVDFSKYPSYTFSCNISTNILRAMIFGYSSKSDALRNVNRIARTLGTVENVRTISRDSFVSEVAGDVNSIKYIVVYFYGSSTTAQDLNNGEIQVEIGSTATAFEPYNGASYPVTWSEAGTVYGGTLDVINGILTVTMAMVDLGTLNWNYLLPPSDHQARARFAARMKDIASGGGLVCDKLIVSTFGDVYAGVCDNAIASHPTVKQIEVRATAYTNAATFKAAMSGVQLVYELAEPVTYQLTPVEIESLAGANNIWADTGDISLTYYNEITAAWQTTIPEANKYARYLWWYYHTVYTNGNETDSEPAIIGIYNDDWADDAVKAQQMAQQAQDTANSAAGAAGTNKTAIDTLQDVIYGTEDEPGLQSEISTLKSNTTVTASSLEKLRTDAVARLNTLESQLGQYQAWIRFDGTNGLIIGKEKMTTEEGQEDTSVNPYVLQLEGDCISFYEATDIGDKSKRVGYIQNKLLYIESSIFSDQMDLGNFRFVKQDSGNLSLVWKG